MPAIFIFSYVRLCVRLEDASAAVWDAFPEEYHEAAQVVTDVGGPEGSIFLLALIYWLADRERTARVAMYAVVGAGVITSLKFAFALPRPLDPAIATDGYGFPSGHAFTATVVYGGLVVAYERARDPRAVAVAGVAIAAVALSRVVLRVHYLGDILVGAALGLVVLAVLSRFVEDLRVGFAIGVAMAVAAIVISGAAEPARVALGTALGGFGASLFFDAVPREQSRTERGLTAAVGLAYVAVLIAVLEGVLGEPTGVVSAALAVALYAALLVGVFTAPVAVRYAARGRLPTRDAEESA
jgi:hypothetical protein